MESALTGVDVYVFERLSAGDLNSTSANASNNVRAACKNVSRCVEELHHVLRIRVTQITTAMTVRMA